MEVAYHPYFLEWFEELVDLDVELGRSKLSSTPSPRTAVTLVTRSRTRSSRHAWD